MSWLDILTKAGGAVGRTAKTYPLETGLLAAQVGLSGGAAVLAQKGYKDTLKRADRVRQLAAVDRQLAAIDATRRLSTIKASNASPGYATLGVRGTYGSPVDTLMFAEASELKQLERMELAHRYMVKDIEDDAKLLRQAGFFQAGQSLIGAAAQFGVGVKLGKIEKEGILVRRDFGNLFDAPGPGHQRKKIDFGIGEEVLG
jgi:hypothetical protein